MLPDKPSVPTSATPNEIVGGMMSVFLKHFEICGSGTGDFPDKALDSKIGVEARATIGEIYKDLRNHGFYPGYIVAGKMVWRTALKCKTYDAVCDFEPFDKKIEDMSKKELRDFARGKFCNIGNVDDFG